MVDDKKKGQKLKRYLRRLIKALEGQHSKRVEIFVTLTGSAADQWATLREASMGLPIEDQELVVLMLLRSARKIRKELREMDREECK